MPLHSFLHHLVRINPSAFKGDFRPYCIYPNPVKDRLSIQFSPDVKPESIELYDVSGRCVASSRTAEMDVANLPAGQYVARITLEGGKVYSDKVVKE